MSYPEPGCKSTTPHLDAAAIGFLFWLGVGILTKTWESMPAWFFVLAYCAVGFWLTGWILKFAWWGARRIWNALKRLEIEP
jgi:predicted tellurium resistance membrane protein TerC